MLAIEDCTPTQKSAYKAAKLNESILKDIDPSVANEVIKGYEFFLTYLVQIDPYVEKHSELSDVGSKFLDGLSQIIKLNPNAKGLRGKIVDIGRTFSFRLFDCNITKDPRPFIHYVSALKDVDMQTGDIVEKVIEAGYLPKDIRLEEIQKKRDLK